MHISDFEYDGMRLSDYGFTVCDFDQSSSSTNTSAGGTITFNKAAMHDGLTNSLTSTTFDECIQATFSICKTTCGDEALEISDEETRSIMRWLNRRQFCKFVPIPDGDTEIEKHYYGSFNINKIMYDGVLYGFELTLETNSPYGFGERFKYTLSVTDTSKEYTVLDKSDEIGFLYPDVTITCKESGTLTIVNKTTGKTTVIKNVASGETITIMGIPMIIKSSLASHVIAKDFNYEFPVLQSTLDEHANIFTFSLKCDVSFSYEPIIKDAPM